MQSVVVSRAVRRHAAEGLTARKLGALRDLAEAWQEARSRYLVDYWPARYAAAVLVSPRSLRDERRERGWSHSRMPVAYHQTALFSALGVLRGSWNLARRRVADHIGRDHRLSSTEKRWISRVLRDPQLLQQCLDGELVDVVDPATKHLALRLRRLVLNARPRRPRPQRRLWLELDAEMYRAFSRAEDRRFRGSWVAVASQRPGVRIPIPLAGPRPLLDDPDLAGRRPTIRLVVSDRPLFVVRVRSEVVRHGGSEIGVDKGYLTSITASGGSPFDARSYGTGADELVARIALSDDERRDQRRRLALHARRTAAADAHKARRIRRRNLGPTRVQRRARRERACLRNAIDRALNAMFRLEAPLSRIFAERLDIRGRALSRGSNRRLGRWSNGYMHRRLAYKAELNGVELVVVNAAYTSQTCPVCWFTSGSNRRGTRFKCIQCGFTGSADAVAATNVLARGRDPAVSGFISRVELKRILDERWRTARSGRAWGSNDAAVLTPDNDQELLPAGAANNWPVGQSTSAKPHSGNRRN